MRLRLISSAILILSACGVASADEPADRGAQFRTALRALRSDDPESRADAVDRLKSHADMLWGPVLDPEKNFLRSPLEDVTIDELDGLISALESPDVARTAACLIGLTARDGAKAIPALTRLIQTESADHDVRRSACLALARVLPADKPIGPILLPIVKGLQIPEVEDPDDATEGRLLGMSRSTCQLVDFSAVMYSMMFTGTDRTLTEVPHLVEATSPKYPRMVRLVAIGILGAFQFDGRAAISPLRRLLADEDLAVRGFTVLALMQIEDDPSLSKMRLAETKLEGQDASNLRAAIADWSERRSEERKSLALSLSIPDDVEEEFARTQSSSGYCRRYTIHLLGESGRMARPVLPGLRKLLEHPEEATRRLAAEAIRKIESDR